MSRAEGSSPPSPLQASQSSGLEGTAKIPGDKSISHRALIMGLLTTGETEIDGLLEGDDVLRTAEAIKAFGAHVAKGLDGVWRVTGAGLGSLLQPETDLNFGNAGTGARLMMGVVAGHPLTCRFDGDSSLRARPMKRVTDPLRLFGAEVLNANEGVRLPLTLRGARQALPAQYETPVASAQVKSAVLFASLNAPGETVFLEAQQTRDHTERLLVYFGCDVRREPFGEHGQKITVRGQPELSPRRIVVPADPSSAAFPIIAALIVPNSDVLVTGVLDNPHRTGFLDVLREMGGDVTIFNQRDEGNEKIFDLRVRSSKLRGVTIPANRAPSMIDEYPILSIAAAFAEGETRMEGLQELRVKESDRLSAIANGLKDCGVAVSIQNDDLYVTGASRVRGGAHVKTHSDHRIAMSFLIAGLATETPITIDDDAMIATSFPAFSPMMRELGATFSTP